MAESAHKPVIICSEELCFESRSRYQMRKSSESYIDEWHDGCSAKQSCAVKGIIGL